MRRSFRTSLLAFLAFLAPCPIPALSAQELAKLDDIKKDYAENVVAADARYLGKNMVFGIKLARVAKDSAGTYFLVPKSPAHVRCYFSGGQADKLAALKVGDEIVLRGVFQGWKAARGSGSLVFSECKLGACDSLAPDDPKVLSTRRSLLVVKGARGAGSGFVAELGGVRYAISNFHVFDDNSHLKLIDCDNRELEFKRVLFAHDRDIALFELDGQNAPLPLEIQKDIAVLPVGTPVRNYGNSAGEGVFTDIGGKVLGVGPRTIEVDAPFVSGNSGSPVLAFPDMKVLGVATYIVLKWADMSTAGTRFSGVRRYATRIDNVDLAKLELYDKSKFDADKKALDAYVDRLLMKIAALDCLKGVGPCSEKSQADFQLYAGKIPDSSLKVRIATLIRQWNSALESMKGDSSAEMPSTRAASHHPAAMVEKSNDGRPTGILDSGAAGASIYKIPYAALRSLLFPQTERTPLLHYKRFQEELVQAEDAEAGLKKNFDKKYEDIKAVLRK